MKKLILLVLLGLNSVAELAGGTLMVASPGKAAVDVFRASASSDVQRLLPIIGAATLGYAAISSLCMLWIARGRRAGFELAGAFGLLLTGIGVIMLATGTSAGRIDVAKGLLIMAAAWWAASEAREPATI